MRKITTIVLHCSATQPHYDVDIRHVREWHVKGNKWRDVGYHYFIKLDGTIQHGRPVHVQGAGVRGHNSNTVHVCYAGGLNDDGDPHNTLNADQRAAIYQVCTSLVRVFGPLEFIGHNDLTDEKACPSFKVSTEMGQLVEWCRTGEGHSPVPNADEREPEKVAPRKYCRRCHRRFRM